MKRNKTLFLFVPVYLQVDDLFAWFENTDDLSQPTSSISTLADVTPRLYFDFVCQVRIGLKEGRKEVFYLTMHTTHFIYSYMASDIW